MLPEGYDDFSQDFTIKKPATRTYRLSFDGTPSFGMLDGLEAMKQAIFLILNTDRFQYELYSWNYGVELIDKLGQPNSLLLQSKIKSAVVEALQQDGRVQSVDAVSFANSGTGLLVGFTVATTEGTITSEVLWSGSDLEVRI